MDFDDNSDVAPGVGLRFMWLCFFALPMCMGLWLAIQYSNKGDVNPCTAYGGGYYLTQLDELSPRCTDGSEGNFKSVP